MTEVLNLGGSLMNFGKKMLFDNKKTLIPIGGYTIKILQAFFEITIKSRKLKMVGWHLNLREIKKHIKQTTIQCLNV